MMNSLKTIYNNQIEKFRDLKIRYDEIIEEKKLFNYDEKLAKIEQDKKNALEVINSNEMFSETVKKATRTAIEQEFLENKKSLDTEYAKFGERLMEILSERKALREDKQYQKAMQARKNVLHAKSDMKKLEENRQLAQDQVNAGENRLEQAKKELELAKQSLQSSKDKLKKIDDGLELSATTVNEAETLYEEKIKDTFTIQEKILDTVLEMMDTGIKIDICELKKPLPDIIRRKIYSAANISRLGGHSKDVKDMVKIDLGNHTDYKSLKAGDRFSVSCTCGKDGDKITSEIEITITGDTDISKEAGTELSKNDDIDTSTISGAQETHDEEDNTSTTSGDGKDIEEKSSGKGKKKTLNKGKEKQAEMDQAIETVKQFILHKRQKDSLTSYFKLSVQKEPIDEEMQMILEKLATIYLNYGKKADCLELIFDLNVSVDTMKKFIDLAHERSVEHGSNLESFEEIKSSIEKLVELKGKTSTSKREKKDIEFQILGYRGMAFGVNMAVELGISDIQKSGLILSGDFSGNSKRKRGKGKK